MITIKSHKCLVIQSAFSEENNIPLMIEKANEVDKEKDACGLTFRLFKVSLLSFHVYISFILHLRNLQKARGWKPASGPVQPDGLKPNPKPT